FRMIRLEAAHAREELYDLQDSTNRREILPSGLVDIAMLDLDGNAPAVAQRGRVDLRQRRRSDRIAIECLEQVLGRISELGADSSFDLVVRPRRKTVLQALELLPECAGQEVREDADQLSDFDEQSARGEDRAEQPPRVRDMTPIECFGVPL